MSLTRGTIYADLRRGEDYEKAKRCIVITILDYELDDGTDTDYHNVYMLRSKDGALYTDVLELHTIELKKKPRQEQSCPLDEWHQLFNAETEEELDMLKSGTKNLGIIEAIKELKEISLSDRLHYEHEMRLKAKRDRYAEDQFIRVQAEKEGMAKGFEQGMAKGLEQGMTKGLEQGINALVHFMRGINATDEQIINALMTEYGISKEEAQERVH